jgi:hypothetical protein
MRKFYKHLFLVFSIILTIDVSAQKNYFSDVSEQSMPFSKEKRDIIPAHYRTLKVDVGALHAFLWSLPKEKDIINNRSQTPVMLIPMPGGGNAKFHVWESSIQEPGLEAKFPEIKTFSGQGIDDPFATVRFDYSPYFGFRAQILSSATGRIYIDHFRRNDPSYCISYFNIDNYRKSNFQCLVDDTEYQNRIGSTNSTSSTMAGPCLGTTLRTYRLAVSCTGEYAAAVGGAQAGPTHAAIVTTTNRVDGVYEVELAVRMVLVANNNLIEYLNGTTDPFTNVISSALLNSNQNNTDLVIGTANYDIGHIFTSDDNGLAGLGVVCVAGNKARGATGAPELIGDGFDIDYVAHEMGHEFGASHSFNSNTCASAGGSYEPGGGTTIMAYAGICAPNENIQPHSDPIFHAISFDQIGMNISSGNGATCAVTTPTGNTLPVITSMPQNNLTIPINTPFTLRGSATDADGDAITYNWEGFDVGSAGTWTSAATSTTRPLFRTRVSKTVGERTFPDPRVIAANYPGVSAPSAMDGLRGEVLPTVARAMKFRLTVRDNRAGGGGVVSAGSGCQDAAVFQVNTSGSTPFKVMSPNGGESYEGGSQQTVLWTVANTNAAPFNTPNVKISISTDGGLSFPTVLIASTANDGSEVVTMPFISTTTARIKVEAVENIFFDISNNNFTLTAPSSGFTLSSPAPANITCGAGTSSSITLNTSQVGNFTTPINFTYSGAPAGTTVNFSPNPVTPGVSTNVTLSPVNNIPAGSYSVVVTGTAGTAVQTTTLTWVVAGGSAPAITTNPSSVSVCAGSPATFNAVATGNVSYQWQVDTGTGFSDIAGATNSSYTIPSVSTAQNGNQYRVVVTALCGISTSTTATLTILTPAQITAQPVSAGSCIGSSATFSVTATGSSVSYQWQVSTSGCGGSFTNIPGATSSTYTANNLTAGMNGNVYRVNVTGACASGATSNCVTLTVGAAASITTPPANSTVCEGQSANFNVSTTGSVTGYQWEVNSGTGFTDISGATNATLNLPSVTTAMSGNQYRVKIFTCTANPLVSNAATLTVNQLASISNQPINTTVCEGVSNSFVAAANGTGLTYQWQYASSCGGSFSNIPGANAASLNLTNITQANVGAYHLVVTGTCNSVTSNCVNLAVNTPFVINTQPQDVSICLPVNSANFSVGVTGSGLSYQWQVSTDGGASYNNIAGATSPTLTVNNITSSFNNNKYRVVVNGNCTSSTNSSSATMLVNSNVNITSQPLQSGSHCVDGTAIINASATGASLTYQWQQSADGVNFANITDGGVYSGTSTSSLNISPLSTGLNGSYYRLIVTGAPCGAETTDAIQLEVNEAPAVTLSASSSQGITPTSSVTLTASVTPPGTYTYTWYKNGNVDPTKTGSSIIANVDDLGSWEVEATSAQQCSGRSAVVEVDYAQTNTMFTYPNPNKGRFVVRYFSSNLTTARSISVYDSKGALVYQKMFTINAPYTGMQIDLINAASGVYMVDLRDASGKRIASSKIVVE